MGKTPTASTCLSAAIGEIAIDTPCKGSIARKTGIKEHTACQHASPAAHSTHTHQHTAPTTASHHHITQVHSIRHCSPFLAQISNESRSTHHRRTHTHLHQLPSQLLQLPFTQFLGVHGDAALGPTKGDVHHGSLPGHETRQAASGRAGGMQQHGSCLLVMMRMHMRACNCKCEHGGARAEKDGRQGEGLGGRSPR